jgi:hypothetical protein
MFYSEGIDMADYGSTDRVRRTATEQYIAPARRRNETTVKIHSGAFGKFLVQNNILPPNRFPIICNALKSGKFLKENRLVLEEIQGPPSGRSSTVTFVYKVEPQAPSPPGSSSDPDTNSPNSFLNLRGILKETYKQFGGAEQFHRRERESWDR